jgi:hypothetical protein
MGQVAFRYYAEQWRSIRLHRPNSTAHVETMLRRHVYPTLGSQSLDTIVHSDMQSWVQTLSVTNGLASSTVRVIHDIVSSVAPSRAHGCREAREELLLAAAHPQTATFRPSPRCGTYRRLDAVTKDRQPGQFRTNLRSSSSTW